MYSNKPFMKKPLHILFILLLLFPSVGVFSQSDSINVFVRANVQSDRIQLRWAVNSPEAWRYTNVNGFKVERYTVLRNGSALLQPELSTFNSITVKPRPLAEWEYIAQSDHYAAIIAQALYGSDFEVSGGQRDVGSIIALSQEQEQRYAMSMLAAELSYPAALFAGWGFEDTTAVKGEKYLYRIIPVSPDKKKIVEYAGVYAGMDDAQELPRPAELDAVWGDHNVLLTWNYRLLENYYAAYRVERSEDGKSFSPLHETPLTNITGTDRMYYSDSIANGKTYYYRLRGQNAFGDLSAYSDTLQGKGKAMLRYSPFITRAVPDKSGNVSVEWEFDERGNSDIQGFELRRGESDKGRFETVVSGIAPEERKTVFESPLSENYLIIAAIPKDSVGEPALSFPHFLQMEDSVPPAVPQGLAGSVDTLGIVRLTWQANTESDIYGYRVYRAQNSEEELIPLNDIAVRNSEFTDTVQIKNLNSKVYYAVTSLDRRYNQSALSERVELAKPDLIPPSPPLITKAAATGSGVRIDWVSGRNENIGNYRIVRDNEILAANISSDSLSYTDMAAVGGQVYSYEVIAVNKSGLPSEPSPAMPVKAKEKSDGAGKITSFKAVKGENGVVLRWETDIEKARSVSLYRKEGEQPFMLLSELDSRASEFTDTALQSGIAFEYLLVIKSPTGIPVNATVKINY